MDWQDGIILLGLVLVAVSVYLLWGFPITLAYVGIVLVLLGVFGEQISRMGRG